MKQLFIGIHGFAGSGKDTVTKMIRTILSKNWKSLEECKQYYNSIYLDPTISATYDVDDDKKSARVFCIAFADQLKLICSTIFGIPVKRFYMNKSTAWVCINKDFKYTEIKPDDNYIVTAEEYYDNFSKYSIDENRYWLSLRELLVYIGTYVLQQDVNKSIFVNVVNNLCKYEQTHNNMLSYVICTDVRFTHELDYIRKKHGIMIDVVRDSVTQLDNIAEHDLDEETDYDYVINNSGTYDDLFKQVWDMIHNNCEFKNMVLELYTNDNADNYLRLIGYDNFDTYVDFKLCYELGLQSINYNEGKIYQVTPICGPTIEIGHVLETSESDIIPTCIIDNDGDIIIRCVKN